MSERHLVNHVHQNKRRHECMRNMSPLFYAVFKAVKPRGLHFKASPIFSQAQIDMNCNDSVFLKKLYVCGTGYRT